ncbi:hypothetical protein [Methylobacterium komagatae]
MSNVPVLPIDRLTVAQLRRLADELQAASEAGTDLGSRRAHIDAGAAALQKLVAALYLAVDDFAAKHDPEEPASRDVLASLRQYVERVERIMALATDSLGDHGSASTSQAGTNAD